MYEILENTLSEYELYELLMDSEEIFEANRKYGVYNHIVADLAYARYGVSV